MDPDTQPKTTVVLISYFFKMSLLYVTFIGNNRKQKREETFSRQSLESIFVKVGQGVRLGNVRKKWGSKHPTFERNLVSQPPSQFT